MPARSAGGLRGSRRLERLLELLGVFFGQRGPDHGTAVLLERGDRLVGRHLLYDHVQRGRSRLEVVAHLLLERLVDPLLAEVAEQRAHSRAEREPEDRDEEQQAEQEAPEASPRCATAGGRAAVRGLDVVLALDIARDRRDLVGLDDQLRLELEDRLPGLLSGRLIGIADRNERCHYPCLLSAPGTRRAIRVFTSASGSDRIRSSPETDEHNGSTRHGRRRVPGSLADRPLLRPTDLGDRRPRRTAAAPPAPRRHSAPPPTVA